MTLSDYQNDNDHAAVKKMFVLLSPRNKFDGSGGLESLGLYTDVEYAAANSYGTGINGTNAGVGVAHVDANMLPDPIIGRENQQYYPSLFIRGKKVVGTYLDEARRDRFGIIPEIPVQQWSDIKIQRFNNLNRDFGDRYGDRVKEVEALEYRQHAQSFNNRPRDYMPTAYVVMLLTPSTKFAPHTSDIAAIFYGEANSEQEAVERTREFRFRNPTAPKMIVVPVPVNSTVEHFNHSMYLMRTSPETMPYHEEEMKSSSVDVREYENMLDEVARPRIDYRPEV